jgi:hypothetical protein
MDLDTQDKFGHVCFDFVLLRLTIFSKFLKNKSFLPFRFGQISAKNLNFDISFRRNSPFRGDPYGLLHVRNGKDHSAAG